MAKRTDDHGLAIGELVARTGLSEGTLRMWERRHGFPRPRRLPSGHRRYGERDVELVLRVVRERDGGLSLPAAIARARETGEEPEPSIFAGLRRRGPALQPIRLRKPVLLALSHALEDESCAHADRPLLIGSFQRERFYRQSQRRWREYARTAELAIVFADFDRPHTPAHGPAELPVGPSQPLVREWAVVCEGPGHAACLAAVEVAHARRRADAAREFDVIWSVEPELVRAAAEIGLELARQAAPQMEERIAQRLSSAPPGPPVADQLRLSTAIATRALGQLT
ncbi:MAG TPA: DICT sensory domain-containing protein [Thermoleophilaceae bacterium]|nr:DICT sensory domain-containing protein [Thermoleophilaceae bacterium]